MGIFFEGISFQREADVHHLVEARESGVDGAGDVGIAKRVGGGELPVTK